MRLLAEIALVAVAAVGVAASLWALPKPARPRRGRASSRRPPRPEQLIRLERLVSGSQSSALQAHAYLRPLLAEIAARRLAARGQTLERMNQAAGERVLGPPLWEIVRPGRPFPEDRHGPGVRPRELAAMLDVLERL